MASKKYTGVTGIALAITCGGTTAAHADPDKVAYELAERCGQRAEKMFNDQKISGVPGTYESHYNANLNGCFAVIWAFSVDSSSPMKTWGLYDVNDNHLLAYTACMQHPSVADSADVCAGADIRTPPDAEFRAAMQRYMER